MAKNKRSAWSDDIRLFDFTDKANNVTDMIADQLNRTSQAFLYKGLPGTIDVGRIEEWIQMSVPTVLCKNPKDGEWYVCFGTYTGELDANYRPKGIIITNPWLDLNKTYWFEDDDCVEIYNDKLRHGLRSIMVKYATAITENEISLVMASIIARTNYLLSAGDDATKKSADQFIKDLFDGKLSAVAESQFFEGIRAQDISAKANSGIKSLIELQQYLVASWDNKLGIQANYNMKREALNSAETSMSDLSLMPMIDEMIHCREAWIEEFNQKSGCNATVELHSAWKHLADMYNKPMTNPEGEPIPESEISPVDEDLPQDEQSISSETNDLPEASNELTEQPEGENVVEESQEPVETPQEVIVEVNVNVNTDEETETEEQPEDEEKESEDKEDGTNTDDDDK